MFVRLFVFSAILSAVFVGNYVEAATETIRVYPIDDAMMMLDDIDGINSWNEARNYEGIVWTDPVLNSKEDLLKMVSFKSPYAYRIRRSSLVFDTSLIPENAEISLVNLDVYKGSHDNVSGTEIVFTEHRRSSSTLIRREDWNIDNFGTIAFARGSLLDNVYTRYVFSSDGVNYINTNGHTIVGALTGSDFEDTPVSGAVLAASFYSVDASGTSTDPYLEITYTVPDESVSLSELLALLLELIENGDFEKQVKNSYLAHLKKIEDFYDTGRIMPAKNQLNQFVSKLIQDNHQGLIEGGLFGELLVLSNDVLVLLQEEEAIEAHSGVPLITQVVSPYPSVPETESWANNSYASGTAASSCGTTIRQCGCALASMSMLAHSYGVTKGVNGEDINPGTLNDWLTENNGYTAYGGALWGKVLEYFGKKNGDTITTNFTLKKHNATSSDEIGTFVKEVGPAVAFSNSLGHFFVLTGVLENGYSVRDPFWYETKTTGDAKDVLKHIQGYSNVVSKANLFTHSKQPHKLASMIEAHLGSPAELLLIDSNGDRVGYDPDEGLVNETRSGSYDQAASIFTDTNVPNPHEEKVLIDTEPDAGPYELQVIGTGAGEYSLTLYTVDELGRSNVVTFSSSTAPGLVHTYDIDLFAEDDDRGHGNEEDECDEDNAGEGGACAI